jgi:hypothetical protein
MFCPNCGAEYVEGIVECADCRLKLVAEPPHPGAGKPIEYEELLSTFNQGDIALIKSILEDAKVDYFFRGEYFNQLDPLIQPARLFVKKGHLERAKKALEKLNVSFLGVSGERK